MFNFADARFVWTADVNGDGVPEVERYNSTLWLPDIDRPDGGRNLRGETVDHLGGGIVQVTRARNGKQDHRGPGRFTLTFEVAEESFLAIAEEDFARARRVAIRLDHRWRQLRVTSSGLADRKVTVEAGYLILSPADTAWLSTAAVYTCGATHTCVYVTASGGALTVGSGTEVPGGATQLAVISVAGSVVTVLSNPSGVANARTCQVAPNGFRPRQAGGGLTGCEIELQEVGW